MTAEASYTLDRHYPMGKLNGQHQLQAVEVEQALVVPEPHSEVEERRQQRQLELCWLAYDSRHLP